ncbi:MAG: DUF692 domain-containing protein [Sphingomonadaceae bacterium]|uniref:DUF692 domain-containing protein n=1 Tax=Thermaurantiacus sp. TaxID=2820283 RepID=UPI00298F12F8|nr:DUF692 family multinuclear iron-containing protein [Thermaurantiacus sp.]MCS6986980.1 DUF692 domain-containing protein [Sphingomonadaceae bacterium]MDW8415419.1 DUF692 family protein [Thermaurantiacus sp.]
MAQPAFAPLFHANGGPDFLAVIPDMFLDDAGPSANPRFRDLHRMIGLLDAVELPQVAHHLAASLASAVEPDPDYVEAMANWADRWNCAWVSDHLAFMEIAAPGGASTAGLALTPPFDRQILDLMVPRIQRLLARLRRPFLIENSAYFVRFEDSELDEPAFLNELCARSGCGLLLDLHNLYVNAVNFGFDPFAFLGGLDLSRVVEIHIAGGCELEGVWSDAHAGPPPEPVWALLDACARRCPNLRAVTFEMHESWLPEVGMDAVAATLARARALWPAAAAGRRGRT